MQENLFQNDKCLPVCLTVCLSPCLSVCLSVCLYARLSVCLPVCLPVCLSACLFVCMLVCLSDACLPICLSLCLYACLPACMLVCLSASLYTWPSVCLSFFMFLPVCGYIRLIEGIFSRSLFSACGSVVNGDRVQPSKDTTAPFVLINCTPS